MQLEEFSLNGATRLSGHSHPTLHVLLVESGRFEEQSGNRWFACGSGTTLMHLWFVLTDPEGNPGKVVGAMLTTCPASAQTGQTWRLEDVGECRFRLHFKA